MSDRDKESLAQAFSTLASQLEKHHDFSKEELVNLIRSREGIPVTAFNTSLTPLETLARFLERNPDRAKILNRPKATLSNALKNSKKKHPGQIKIQPTNYTIPVEEFSDRKYSVLEHLCRYLKQQYGLKNKEIAKLIGKDPKTVWTVLDRAKKKGGAS